MTCARWAFCMVTGLVGLGCAVETGGDEPAGANQQGIINGDLYPADDSGQINIWHGGPGTIGTRDHNSCTGTLLNNDSVLTARHCVTFDRNIFGPLEPDLGTFQLKMGSQTRQVVDLVDFGSDDVALLVADRFFTMHGNSTGYFMDVWPGANADLVGRNVFCLGYGVNSAATDPATADILRSAVLTVSAAGSTRLSLPPNSSGQALWKGDSGGGCLVYTPAGFFTTGVNTTCFSAGSTCQQVAPQLVEPFARRNYTRGTLHTATTSNTTSHITTVHSIYANDDPNALVYVMPNFNGGSGSGVYNDHEVGVYYASGRWRIFNEDFASMPIGATFNVSVGGGFLHRVTSSNRSGHVTTIDSPALNNRPGAAFVVTQNWNPGGGSGVYNPHSIGVWYNGISQRWTIYNQDFATMPLNAAFNVRVERSYSVRPGSLSGHVAYLDDPNLNGQPQAKLFVSSNYNAFGSGPGVYNNHSLGVWYNSSNGRWAVYNQDFASMPANVGFNVMVRP